jgi:DNA-binding MarR family transcriptional regulator
VEQMTPRNSDAEHGRLDDALHETPVYRVLLLGNLIGQPFFGRFGKRFSMTLNEWRIMSALSGSPGTSISEICEMSGLHIMNVSRGVKGLERHGRVIRKTDPDDRRRTLLELSDEGNSVFREIAPQGLEWADKVCEVLSEKEKRSFDRLLNKMITHIRSQGEDLA